MNLFINSGKALTGKICFYLLCAILFMSVLIFKAQAVPSKNVFLNLPLNQAIFLKSENNVAGKKNRSLAIFVDPECKYCLSMEKNVLPKISNLSVYVFIAPILGDNSENITNDIFCAKDPRAAWLEFIKSKKVSKTGLDCSKKILKNQALLEDLKVETLPFLILDNGKKIRSSLSKEALEAELAK